MKCKDICSNWKIFFILVFLFAISLSEIGCGDDNTQGVDTETDSETNKDTETDIDSDMDTDTDTNSDSDSNTDTDSDLDTDECDPTDKWGDDDSVQIGVPVANWQLNGIFDKNGDGSIKKEELTPSGFNLIDIYCSGKNSIVLVKSDVT